MADRLRALLDRPLDPSAARAILAFASAILLGLAALFALAASEAERPTSQEVRPAAASPSAPGRPGRAVEEAAEHRLPTHRQDPQDARAAPPPDGPLALCDRIGRSSTSPIATEG